MLTGITASDLLKTSGILTVAPGATLAQALAKLRSSHDAVFVIDGKRLRGLISPYFTLFRGHYPPKTKVEHCLFSPPKLKLTTPLVEIARQMVESKVYFLPVFSNGDWQGIVSYRRILRLLAGEHRLPAIFQVPVTRKPIVVADDRKTLGQARELMTKSGVSRLVVTDSHGHLTGMVTRYDLREAIAQPMNSPSFLARDGQKDKLSKSVIAPYIKKIVAYLPYKTPLSVAVKKMVEDKVGSVVLVDNDFRAIGLVSTRDVLQAVSQIPGLAPALTVDIDADFNAKNGIVNLVTKAYQKLFKRGQLKDLWLRVKLNRNAAGAISKYTVILNGHHPLRGTLVAKITQPQWKDATHMAIEKLAAQLRRGVSPIVRAPPWYRSASVP